MPDQASRPASATRGTAQPHLAGIGTGPKASEDPPELELDAPPSLPEGASRIRALLLLAMLCQAGMGRASRGAAGCRWYAAAAAAAAWCCCCSSTALASADAAALACGLPPPSPRAPPPTGYAPPPLLPPAPLGSSGPSEPLVATLVP